MAFLKREYKTMIIVIVCLFLIIGLCIKWVTAILYVVGACFSVLAGFFGMNVATLGNVRTANAAKEENTRIEKMISILNTQIEYEKKNNICTAYRQHNFPYGWLW